MRASAGEYGAGEVLDHSEDPMHVRIFGKIHYPRRLKGKAKLEFYTNPESRVRPQMRLLIKGAEQRELPGESSKWKAVRLIYDIPKHARHRTARAVPLA
jgi:hypothetical protein